MAFIKGNKLAKGGKREGAGKPPDWLKNKCAKIIENKKLIEWLGNVASGEAVDTRIIFDDDNVPHHEKLPASVKDRLRAYEMLSDRAFGKPAQALELAGKDGGPLKINVVTYVDGPCLK